jgi:Protein of unknown function (DUF3592)
MSAVIGIWFALAGGLAALAGLTGRRRVRRLRRSGLSAWAMVLPSPVSAGEDPGGSSGRALIQYVLEDGRVIERICPGPARKAASLGSGQKVLVWYDPADPWDILVHGRAGWYADGAFVAVGMLFVLIGAGIAVAGH